MGKAKDKLEWFGEKGSAATDTVKLAGQGILAVTAVAITGAVLGTVGKAFGGK